jgi:hypothetical protein
LNTYPRATRHSLEHYRRVLLALRPALVAGYKNAAIAAALNDAEIPSATGLAWTDQAVTSVLKKLRLKTGPLYRAMLELCFQGAMSPSLCRPLLQSL